MKNDKFVIIQLTWAQGNLLIKIGLTNLWFSIEVYLQNLNVQVKQDTQLTNTSHTAQ